jgi:iron complex outermembrane receptor protein
LKILADGASAVYGSDAIGGVVNIITKKDFNG